MPKPGRDPKRSITSWTTPEPGDVISYAYLWHHEAAKGQGEGLKDRPSVVVLAQQIVGDRTQLIVAPVTHSPPQSSDGAIELPVSVKTKLGLDSDRSWIQTNEINIFVWPGPDVRIAKQSPENSPLIGAIPEWLFLRLRDAIGATSRVGKLKSVKRSD